MKQVGKCRVRLDTPWNLVKRVWYSSCACGLGASSHSCVGGSTAAVSKSRSSRFTNARMDDGLLPSSSPTTMMLRICSPPTYPEPPRELLSI